jgi:hypothetical protein
MRAVWLVICGVVVAGLAIHIVRAEMITSASKPRTERERIWAENTERMGQALMKGDFAALDTYYNGRQKAYEMGEIDEDVLEWEFKVFEDVYKHPPSHKYLEAWAAASPNSYATHFVMGQMHRHYGHELRGSKWASETTSQQFAGMRTEYTKAGPYFLKSLELTEKPVLSYAEILRMFYQSNVAMEVFAPKKDTPMPPPPGQTLGDVMGKALGQLGASAFNGFLEIETKNFTMAEQHAAMWHYADQGLKIAPNSNKIILAYFELIKPKWYGSEDMMRGFAEAMYQEGKIPKWRKQFFLATIPYERGYIYGDSESEWHDVTKSADSFYEALQYLDDPENKKFYFDALYWYLSASFDQYWDNKLSPELEKRLLPKLDYFIESADSPYKLKPDDKEDKRRYARILTLRATVRMARIMDAKGAWADYNQAYALGDAFGAFKVASTYCVGYPDLVKQDRPKCIKIMKEAATWGDTYAQDALKGWGETWP